MPEYNPLTLPVVATNKRSPNVFEHRAVHPLVYMFPAVGFTLGATAQNFIQFKPGTAALHLTNFSVWDFSLMPNLEIQISTDRLADLILEGASDENPLFLLTPYEEMRWALNVGQNFIAYRPVSRYGRFSLLNRAGSTLSGYAQINVKAV